ncbi:uncharacterized protein [Nicotiana tomentosiformis]|uniref:uncharacterized protein n=1 Tax=Nicotiana tomentosiformis TaxID=4098 RepID=UPI00388CE046
MADDNEIELVDTGAQKQLFERDTELVEEGFKIPKFNLYDGRGDPMAHLRGYCSEMRSVGGKYELLMAYFSESLSGAALEWYTRQDVSKWYAWDDMAQDFVRHFQYNIAIIPDRSSLSKMEKKPEESFREFGLRWREQAARVSPPLDEEEMVKKFQQAQGPTNFSHLIPALGQPFNDVVKMGEMVEEGIKSGKIMSYAAWKGNTEDIQNISLSLGRRKRNRKDVEPRQRQDPAGILAQRFQPQHRPHEYPYTPDNPPQCYFSPQNPQSHTSPSQYSIHNAPPYAPHPQHPQRSTPPPQMSYPPLQAYQPHTHKRFQPKPEYKLKRQQQKEKSFTPIGESYASLFQKLRQLDMLKPIQIKMLNPLPKNFDYSQRCSYCSDAPGHNIEKCWHLKRAFQKLIDAGDITVQNPVAADTSQSPLSVHNETHIVGMICVEKEYENSSKLLRGPLAAKFSALSVSVPKVDLKNESAKGTQKLFDEVNVIEIGNGLGNIDVELNG